MDTERQDSANRSVCLVVPVFNEEERVGESFGALADFIAAQGPGSELVFVDDGSGDGTVAVLMDAIQACRCGDRVSVMRRPHAGKGAAVRAGLATARANIAAFCDVDLATPLEEIERLAILAGDCQGLVIGSRAAPGADIAKHESRRRELAGKTFNGLVRGAVCPGVRDTQCGAKAAPTAHWRQILTSSREDGFAWDVEVIGLALRLGLPVYEVGVRWNHDERTRVRVLRDGMSMVRAVFRIRRAIRSVRRVGVRRAVTQLV